MIHQLCPRCGDYKALRMVGSYEWDTNAGEEIEVDTTLSCKCDLSADEWEGVTANLGREDFADRDPIGLWE